MVDVKIVAQAALKVWFLSLGGLLLLGLWAWFGKWWGLYRIGLRRGGWLTVGLLCGLVLFGLLAFGTLFVWFHQIFFEAGTWVFYFSDTLIRLFPQRFATRSALPTSFAPTVTDNGKLFVTGYSQGGHVAMSTHRLLQESGATITASAPMSGPYAIAAFADAVFYGQVTRGTPLFFAYTAVGYQEAYGNIYTAPTEIFEARYAADIETLLPSDVPRTQLFSEGKLPREQLFSSTPPDPSYAQFTPATTPADLAHVFAAGFGPEHLVTNSFRLAYLQDAQTHPDGGFPTVTDGRPAADPANGLRQAFKTNVPWYRL